MLTVDEARGLVRERVRPVRERESVPVAFALGRMLAGPVTAERADPPFDKSMMDGFAVRSADLTRGGVELELVGEARAGLAFEGRVGPGETVRIMTGTLSLTGRCGELQVLNSISPRFLPVCGRHRGVARRPRSVPAAPPSGYRYSPV